MAVGIAETACVLTYSNKRTLRWNELYKGSFFSASTLPIPFSRSCCASGKINVRGLAGARSCADNLPREKWISNDFNFGSCNSVFLQLSLPSPPTLAALEFPVLAFFVFFFSLRVRTLPWTADFRAATEIKRVLRKIALIIEKFLCIWKNFP